MLGLIANLGPAPVARRGAAPARGRRLYGLGVPAAGEADLPPWSVEWFLAEAER